MLNSSVTVGKVRAVAGRGARRIGLRRPRNTAAPAVTHARPDTPVRNGIVEKFSDGEVSGWITVKPGTRPVQINLFLNNIVIASSWATGVTDSIDRTSWAEVRAFRFFLHDVWRFARDKDRLTVRADGQLLPISGHGMYRRPSEAGPSSPAKLRVRMAQGYLFAQYGRLRLSKKFDTDWQARVLALFNDVRRIVKDRYGYDTFFVYGTLLGAVRENGFIGHDPDFDCAYVSDKNNGQAAARELRELALTFIDAGYVIESFKTHLHIVDNAGTRIDIFHTYFDESGKLSFPFGIAGTSTITKDQWRGVREFEFAGSTGVLPVIAEDLAAHLYGDDWREPRPGFHWPADRKTRADAGIMPEALHEDVYWANFYAHTHYDTGSTFFTSVNARDDMPPTVIDIGCGDGRDSYAFGLAGRNVLGLDRSVIGVAHAAKKAQQVGVADRVEFRAIDVSDVAALRSALERALERTPDLPILFYMRFFLHSIPEDVQQGLMDTIGALARPGDMLAAEFRTDKDAKLAKVHTRHYRRYQSGPGLRADPRHALRLRTGARRGGHRALAVRRRGPRAVPSDRPAPYRLSARRRTG